MNGSLFQYANLKLHNDFLVFKCKFDDTIARHRKQIGTLANYNEHEVTKYEATAQYERTFSKCYEYFRIV